MATKAKPAAKAAPKKETKKTGVRAQAVKLKKEISERIHAPGPAEERDWHGINVRRDELSRLWDEYGKDGELPE